MVALLRRNLDPSLSLARALPMVYFLPSLEVSSNHRHNLEQYRLLVIHQAMSKKKQSIIIILLDIWKTEIRDSCITVINKYLSICDIIQFHCPLSMLVL